MKGVVASANQSVERFFQFSLLGLITSAYFALASSGYLDRPTLILTFLGLLVRAGMVAGWLRFEIPIHVVSLAALGYSENQELFVRL